MRYSYAIWIPATEKGQPQVLEKSLPKIVLRDNPEDPAVIIKGAIDENFHITIDYSISEECVPHQIKLKHTYSGSTGFLVYSLQLPDICPDEDFFVSGLRVEMSTALYHYIKGFFHKHVCHAKEADSKLKAYSSTDPNFSFQKHRQHIIQNVCLSYQDIFGGQVRIVQNELADALVALSTGGNKQRNLNILDRLSVATNNILNEVAFCEFFLRQHATEIQKADRQALRQDIFTLQQLQQQLLFWNNHFHNKFSYADGVNGVKWGVAGFCIGCLSILLSCLLPLFDHSEEKIMNSIKENFFEIQKTRDEIRKYYVPSNEMVLKDSLTDH